MAQVTSVTLYFCAGPIPTADDTARIAQIPGIVHIRNVQHAGDNIEACDAVTAGDGVTIPTQYSGKPTVAPEKPLSIEIVPNNPTFDLSDVEHGDLRAIARFEDGTATDVTTSCAWTSATPGTGTIGAATGIFTPVGVGTSIVTAAYAFAEAGEAGSAYASRALTFVTAPDVDDTVTITGPGGTGGIVYTWKAAPAATGSAAAVQVKTEASPAAAAANLLAAINRQVDKLDDFSSDAVRHPNVHASLAGLVLTVTANKPGTAGNGIATTQVGDEATWGGATLAGGANATTPVSDTTLVTVVA